jgi:hypothetical protein
VIILNIVINRKEKFEVSQNKKAVHWKFKVRFLDARFHPYSTPNTSKSSSSPSYSSANDISVQSDQHPPMTSSPCSSSIDEPTTSLSSFIPLFQSQQIYSTKLNNHDDENDESGGSSKENFAPLSYYSEGIPGNTEGNDEYNTITNGIYPNTTMQSNEHFSYSSKCLTLKKCL